jgi:hypothetical protein
MKHAIFCEFFERCEGCADLIKQKSPKELKCHKKKFHIHFPKIFKKLYFIFFEILPKHECHSPLKYVESLKWTESGKVLLLFSALLCIMYYIWNLGRRTPKQIICHKMADWRAP